MVEVNAPGQAELLGELLRAAGTDDLCPHIGRVGDYHVIRLCRAEQPSREVIKHMVKKAAETEVQARAGMSSRDALPRLGQCLGVSLKAVDLNGAVKPRQEREEQLAMPNSRVKDAHGAARWQVFGGDDAISDEIGKRPGGVGRPVRFDLANVPIPLREPHRLCHPLAPFCYCSHPNLPPDGFPVHCR